MRHLCLRFLLAFVLIGVARAGETEDREIEALLTYVGKLDGAVFIRNGSEHTPAQAVAHLRLKWEKQKDAIHSAEDFIARCATQSSMSGTPYLIRFKDGTTEPSAEILKRELRRLRKPTTTMTSENAELVVLLHGLCRSSKSMSLMEDALKAKGYATLNIDYPSRSAGISELAEAVWTRLQEDGNFQRATRIHFVTHSMGGILVRQFLKVHELPKLGRVVMLGPPNQGSELVDKLGRLRIFGLLNGPAGQELGTEAGSTPNALGEVNFELGVIAGTRSINPINSLLIPGSNDGKVSVERTRVKGMQGHLVLATTHPFMMRNTEVIRATLEFLRSGAFSPSA